MTAAPGRVAPRIGELRLEGVGRRFGTATALSRLDLTIAGGEFVALLGPSGCGKSTALNCLAGLLPLSSGSISLDGRRVDGLPPERRGFGMVFQNYALFPHLTVRRNIGFGLDMRRVGKAEAAARVDRAMELVQLGAHADKYPGQLSGGQQQRVAIARAVVVEPPVVLMDEPLSNLDAKLRVEMRAEIRRLHQTLGLTTVYVTHDQEEALSLSDRLVVLADGVVQQVGTPVELYEAPANRYVADFVGFRNAVELDVVSVDGPVVTLAGRGLRLSGRGRGRPAGRAVAMARPEDLLVDDPAAPVAAPAANAVPARVEVTEYHGRYHAVDATTADGVLLHCRSRYAVAPGTEVLVRVDPDRVLVFDAGSGTGAEPAAPPVAADLAVAGSAGPA